MVERNQFTDDRHGAQSNSAAVAAGDESGERKRKEVLI